MKIKVLFLAVVYTFGFCVRGEVPSLLPAGHRFKLVWHDEFNGDSLDLTKWNYRTNFWGQRFPAFATPEQHAVKVRDGKVHLKLIKLPNGEFASPHLQTGELVWDYPIEKQTKGFWPYAKRNPPKFEHRYGYYECRCRLQQEHGWACAFWMQSITTGACLEPSRVGIEHDIMESFQPGEVIPAAFHYNGYGPDWIGFHCPRFDGSEDWGEQKRQRTMKVDKTAYHTFGMLWEPDGYTLFVDGRQRGEKVGRGREFGNPEAVSQVPEFILISTEPMGYRENHMTGKGDPRLEQAWQAKDEFIVDYVRVYDIVE